MPKISIDLSPNARHVQAVTAFFPCSAILTGGTQTHIHSVRVKYNSVHIDNYHEEYGQPPLDDLDFIVKTLQNKGHIPFCYRMRIMVSEKTFDQNCLTAEECVAYLNNPKVKNHHDLQKTFDILVYVYENAKIEYLALKERFGL